MLASLVRGETVLSSRARGEVVLSSLARGEVAVCSLPRAVRAKDGAVGRAATKPVGWAVRTARRAVEAEAGRGPGGKGGGSSGGGPGQRFLDGIWESGRGERGGAATLA